MYCTECGKECEPTWVDFGIGSYEFWGATGYHEDWQEVSDCCEAEMSYEPIQSEEGEEV